jgi:ketosteroid isomerase-like protein
MRGDMERYLALTHHARGFTLFAPFGGPPSKHEQRAEAVRASAGMFQGGDARLEHVEAHTWGDTLVLVMIERQHGQVGGRPDQDCSLRVTHVYRRDDTGWQLVHRHADPLVRLFEADELAALAGG